MTDLKKDDSRGGPSCACDVDDGLSKDSEKDETI